MRCQLTSIVALLSALGLLIVTLGACGDAASETPSQLETTTSSPPTSTAAPITPTPITSLTSAPAQTTTAASTSSPTGITTADFSWASLAARVRDHPTTFGVLVASSAGVREVLARPDDRTKIVRFSADVNFELVVIDDRAYLRGRGGSRAPEWVTAQLGATTARRLETFFRWAKHRTFDFGMFEEPWMAVDIRPCSQDRQCFAITRVDGTPGEFLVDTETYLPFKFFKAADVRGEPIDVRFFWQFGTQPEEEPLARKEVSDSEFYGLLFDIARLDVSMLPTPDPGASEILDTEFGAFANYISRTMPFSILYPASWEAIGPSRSVTFEFFNPDGPGLLAIVEEDLLRAGYGRLTLGEYVDIAIGAVTADSSVELVSQRSATTSAGLTYEILELSVFDGATRVIRMLYVTPEGQGFSAAYLTPASSYEDLVPLALFSFSTFFVTSS